MDANLVGAMSAVLGSLVGGSATVTTAWLSHKTASRREVVQLEFRNREALYAEFIGESSKLLIDAMTHTLEKPETLLNAYALLNRIRLSASPAVLKEAESLALRITDQYFSGNLSVEAMREIARSEDADPLKGFAEACREDLAAIRAHL